MNKKRELTPLQEAFLTALFGDANGNPKLAKKLAGYAETVSEREIVKALKLEIVELAQEMMALHAPEATIAVISGMREPNQAGLPNKLKAAEAILSKAGVNTPTDSVRLDVPAGGLFIMPAKEKKED